MTEPAQHFKCREEEDWYEEGAFYVRSEGEGGRHGWRKGNRERGKWEEGRGKVLKEGGGKGKGKGGKGEIWYYCVITLRISFGTQFHLHAKE